MNKIIFSLFLISGVLWQAEACRAFADSQMYMAPGGLPIEAKVEGPVQAKVDLQIICLFKHKPQGDTYIEALDDLDQKLDGLLRSLRNRGLFAGDALETILITPPKNRIGAKKLLIIGLGDENTLSRDTMTRVGTVAFREAQQLHATRVAYAPTIRDQGNTALKTGDVAGAVIESVILAYNTDQQMQKEGVSAPYTIALWEMEAGPKYFADVKTVLQQSIAQSQKDLANRSEEPLLKSELPWKK